MSPSRRLRSIGTGCTFEWVSDEAAEEAEVLLDADPFARAELNPLIDRLKRGTLRVNKDYKQFKVVEDEPPLFELTIDSTRPRLRLYFIEFSQVDGVHAIGLMLARKPSGAPDEQRRQQNHDAAAAYARRRM